MHRLFLFFLLQLCVLQSSVLADWGQKTPDEAAEALDELLQVYERTTEDLESVSFEDVQSLSFELQAAQYQIGLFINQASLEVRQATIDEWAQRIRPYNQTLLENAFQIDPKEPYNGLINESNGILNYTYPDEVFVSVSRHTLATSEKMRPRLRAARLLLEHRKITDSDIALVSGMALELKDQQELEWARATAELGMTDGLQFVEEILKIPVPPNLEDRDLFKYTTRFKTALRPISFLGQDAEYLAPLIEARIQEIKSLYPEYPARNFEYDIRVARGLEPKIILFAKNGSGPLLAQEAPSPVEEVAEVIEEVTAPEPSTEEKPAEVVITEPVEEDIEQSSNWLLWLIGALVVAGGIFVLRSRK
jgi:flagellar biosynthesis regulator FlaF